MTMLFAAVHGSGTFRTSAARLAMSASGGEADIRFIRTDV